MATSIDGVLVLQCPGRDEQIVTVVECKTVTTDKTQREAWNRLEEVQCLTGKFDSKCFEVSFNDSLFHLLVWDISYRVQLLHHSATTEVKSVLFVVASLNKIIYACIITFADSDLSFYIGMQQKMEETFQYFTHSNIPNQPIFLPSLYGHAVDIETVRVQQKLAQAVLSSQDIYTGKRGPGHEFIPYAVSEWNHTKGGQDTASRILSNLKVNFRSLTPRAYIYIRFLMTALLNSHFLYRILKNERILCGLKSYNRYKEALNDEASFFDFLFEFQDQWQPSHELLSLMSISSSEYEAAKNLSRKEGILPEDTLSENELRNPEQSEKRLRLSHYNLPLDRRLRLEHQGEDQHCKTMVSKKGSTCILCRTRTTSFCHISKAYVCSQKSRCGSNDNCWSRFHTLDHLTKWNKGNTPNSRGRTGWTRSTTPVSTPSPCSRGNSIHSTSTFYTNQDVSPLTSTEQEALLLLTRFGSPSSPTSQYQDTFLQSSLLPATIDPIPHTEDPDMDIPGFVL
jgi:hypothetical protein